MFRTPQSTSEYHEHCMRCGKLIPDNEDLIQGLYCDNCAETIIYSQYDDILDDY